MDKVIASAFLTLLTAIVVACGGQPALSPSASPAPMRNWPTYHHDNFRTGSDLDAPAHTGALSVAWQTKLDGAVYGQPLVVSGFVIAATERDSVYGLDPLTGRIVWQQKLGDPVPLSQLPCGNIDPLGITGTAAYDEPNDAVFVVAEVTGPQHTLFALDPGTGDIRWSRRVELPGHDPAAHQQRAALTVANEKVYVAFGGLFGDCGDYVGGVVGAPTNGQGDTISYRVPAQREAAIWAAGGPVLDEQGNLYVSVGNGSSTTTYDGSDSVVMLSPTLEQKSFFAPSRWAQDNAGDADLGSVSPTLTSNGYVFISGKNGIGYSVHQTDLGGIGGEVSSTPVCRSYGGTAVVDARIYVPCNDGLRRVTIGDDGAITVGWHVTTGANGPPVVGGGVLWSLDLNEGALDIIDPDSGLAVGQVLVGALPHFASPTFARDLVLVGTMAGVTAVR